MRDLLSIALVTAIGLGVVAAAVGPGDDRLLFVSPPEVVAEEFVRKLATGRYDRAVERLANTAGAEAAVTVQGEALRARAGDVTLVEGEAGRLAGDSATASTRIVTAQAGELEWTFSLVREDGVWRITEWRTD